MSTNDSRNDVATIAEDITSASPRVAFFGLASCFGCQINITNAEKYLMDIMDQIDVQYWQLTSSDPMPEDFDIAVIEGAVTTSEAREAVERARKIADCVITIGACANTAGIPGMAAADYEMRPEDQYGKDVVPTIVSDIASSPIPVGDVIDVDYEVLCCPIDPYDFVKTLHQAVVGSNVYTHTSTLCGECSLNNNGCFYGNDTLCLGLVTQSGCGARCPSLGRPCNGCAGISADANIESARNVADMSGIGSDRLDKALEIFNQVTLSAVAGADEE